MQLVPGLQPCMLTAPMLALSVMHVLHVPTGLRQCHQPGLVRSVACMAPMQQSRAFVVNARQLGSQAAAAQRGMAAAIARRAFQVSFLGRGAVDKYLQWTTQRGCGHHTRGPGMKAGLCACQAVPMPQADCSYHCAFSCARVRDNTGVRQHRHACGTDRQDGGAALRQPCSPRQQVGHERT